MTPPELAYRKGFGTVEAVAKFQAVVLSGDMLSINSALPVTPRKQTDADIFACKVRRSDLTVERNTRPVLVPVGSPEFDAEAQFVLDVAATRDTLLADLPETYPLGMREVSYFMRDVTVQPYKVGQDYCTDQANYDNVQAGNLPLETQELEPGGPVLITTGRHAARYVHDDNPMTPFLRAVGEMISLGIPYRKESDLETSKCDAFSNWGPPFFIGLLGETVRRCGMLSFRQKWKLMVPRPEQYIKEKLGEFLPLAYVEGSPTHPSTNAMHSAVAIAQKQLLFGIFDVTAELPSGNTVGYELELLASNIGLWRVTAGVHYPGDHEAARANAEAIGELIAKEALNPA